MALYRIKLRPVIFQSVALLLVLLLALTGCVSRLKYDQLETQYKQLEIQYKAVCNERDELSLKYYDTQILLKAAKQDYEQLKAEYEQYRARPLRLFKDILEFEQWLAKDKTDKNAYEPGVYNCVNFAIDTATNAAKDGFLIFVVINWEKKHAYNCALLEQLDETTGYPYFIEFEPQNDKIIRFGYLER